MSFQKLACAHLSSYKINDLRVKEDGLFHYRGQDLPKTYILPKAAFKSNILQRYSDQFFASAYGETKRHRFFHHLNSSQALCINLFYPLIEEGALPIFFKFLGIPPGTHLDARFEHESELENATRRTSFDFYIQDETAAKVFVEVKYTEAGFASANDDQEHREKFLATYLPLVEASPFLKPICRDWKTFRKHYQILRNLVHISETSHVVLLFPSANTVVARDAAYARDQLLTDTGAAKLKIVFLDEFVSFLETECIDNSLDGYYQTFRKKYLFS